MAALVWARKVFLRYPMIGNMLICGTMYGSGDLSQQTIRKCEKYDFRSTARVAAVACVFFGPIYFKWYKFLDKLIKGKTPKDIVFKVILDQAVVAPPCICIFYIATSILEGREDKFAELKEKGLKTFVTGTLYWPIVQSINFFLLPTHYRAAYVSLCSFIWTNILCSIKSAGMLWWARNTDKTNSRNSAWGVKRHDSTFTGHCSLARNAVSCARLCWKTVTVAKSPSVEVPHWLWL
ncbi:mpv17-like protein [Liolophura sinensis]|uniref:mpv17-like protein n=1 Tax=Liolophura sinensis TaxID=3198878 RepID=UPI0031591E45